VSLECSDPAPVEWIIASPAAVGWKYRLATGISRRLLAKRLGVADVEANVEPFGSGRPAGCLD
jgi:hypothetical protein